jgi:hypothetical protein
LNSQAETLLTLQEVAQILRIHKLTALRKFENRPDTINLGTARHRKFRVPMAALRKYLAENRIANQESR